MLDGPGFSEETAAVFVFGRKREDVLYPEFLRVLETCERDPLYGAKTFPLVCIPSADFVNLPPDEERIVTVTVGIRVGAATLAGRAPLGPIALDEFRFAEELLGEVGAALWTTIGFEAVAPALHAVGYGPLGGCVAAFGHRQNPRRTVEDYEDQFWDPESEPPPPPGLARVYGKDLEQSPHPDHVLGVEITRSSYWDLGEPIAIDDAAHAARLGAVADGAYYLLAVYD